MKRPYTSAHPGWQITFTTQRLFIYKETYPPQLEPTATVHLAAKRVTIHKTDQTHRFINLANTIRILENSH